ncbi:hypothetical protein BaRGS_00026526 [Batillaria attramentaria]|uniref:Uncharacterized protein n=1 Tax=Batillaria attramentaria TaxID=370345 RepID=A0ABD0K5B7_9CAEN
MTHQGSYFEACIYVKQRIEPKHPARNHAMISLSIPPRHRYTTQPLKGQQRRGAAGVEGGGFRHKSRQCREALADHTYRISPLTPGETKSWLAPGIHSSLS